MPKTQSRIPDELTPQERYILERRYRGIAYRRGYRLKKCRRRDPRAIGYDGFMIIEASRNWIMLGGAGLNGFDFSASLEDVAAFFE